VPRARVQSAITLLLLVVLVARLGVFLSEAADPQAAAFVPLVLVQATVQPAPTATPTPSPVIPAPERGAYVGVAVDLYESSDSGDMTIEEQVGWYRGSIGRDLAIGLVYADFGMPFQSSRIRRLAALNVVPMVTWDPVGVEGLDLQSILSGEWDEYIARWARDAALVGSPMFLSFGHEMNGDWYAHAGALNGGGETTGFGDPSEPDGPERYVAAWRYVHDILQREGATNVSWVFCPNCDSLPKATWNEPINYYPGADYVDWVGLDGYNWGTTQTAWASQWQNFEQVFDHSWGGRTLSTLLAQIPDKPFMIAEFASAEQGGDKAAWISDAYGRIQTDYGRIGAVIWFNLDKETDWRINSSESSLQAYVDAIAGSYWVDCVPVW